MFLKKLFLASASVLMLGLAYHLGASTATAQAPSNSLVAVDGTWVYTANGDVYLGGGPESHSTWTYWGNIFTGGGPVPARTQSWGSVKVQQR